MLIKAKTSCQAILSGETTPTSYILGDSSLFSDLREAVPPLP